MERRNTKNLSIFRILTLLNFLTNDKYSKKNLIEEFKKLSINIKETSISNYINKLKENGIKIKEEKNNKTIFYSFEYDKATLEITQENLKVLYDIKQLLFAQKNYRHIEQMMELFYRVSKFIKDEDIRSEFLDFGYFSTVNWGLVKILEQHCETKDILLLEYILPTGGNKLIQFHVDKIMMNTMSQRLYLYGMLENGYDFFQLPIEQIYTIKKIIRKGAVFNFRANVIKYTISKSAYLNTTLEENETVIKENDNYVTIQTPVINEFALVQRLLHFCPDLYCISEGKIKNMVKEKLEMLKASYEKQTIDK